MTKKQKHYRHKLENSPEPKVEDVGTSLKPPFGQGKMVISSPLVIEDYIKQIPFGEVRTMDQLRTSLAVQADADFACPLTSGIFARVVAEASDYERVNKLPITAPWWRLIKSDRSLNDKFPGGGSLQMELLTQEGVTFELVGRSKKTKVVLTA
jgi:alkylated DNA nucleotide flippase Atl1